MPFIQLRAETTKAKRGDVLPVRADLAKLLNDTRGDAADDERVCRSIPSMETHKRYLDNAGIAYSDDRGRRADFHALRHTYGSLLAKAGVAPRVAMSLMRHTDMRLTMNVYTDPRIFDLAGAVEKLPTFKDEPEAQAAKATGTNGSADAGRTESATSQSARMVICSAGIRQGDGEGDRKLTISNGNDLRMKMPHRQDGAKQAGEGGRTLDIHVGNVTLYH